MKRILGLGLLVLAASASAQDRPVPYWASIDSGRAYMRTGPATSYPVTWQYQRPDLPVRVLKRYENWRMIEDPDGTRGWMLVSLLSDRRTAVVKPGTPREIRSKADSSSPVRYRAESGVVGHIEHCRDGWCHVALGKREGYIRTADIWGVNDGEVVD